MDDTYIPIEMIYFTPGMINAIKPHGKQHWLVDKEFRDADVDHLGMYIGKIDLKRRPPVTLRAEYLGMEEYGPSFAYHISNGRRRLVAAKVNDEEYINAVTHEEYEVARLYEEGVREPFMWVLENTERCPEDYMVAAMQETRSGELLDALLRHGCVLSDEVMFHYMSSGHVSANVLRVMRDHHVRFPLDPRGSTPITELISHYDTLTTEYSTAYHGRRQGQKYIEQLHILMSIYDVNHADVDGTTPLMTVCKNTYHNDLVLITILMKAGADPEKKDGNGRNAINYLEQKKEPMENILPGGGGEKLRTGPGSPPLNAECLPWLYFHNMRRLRGAAKGRTRANGGYNMVDLHEFAQLIGLKVGKDIRVDVGKYLEVLDAQRA